MPKALSHRTPASELLAVCPLFEGMPPRWAERLAPACHVEMLYRGQTLREEGMLAGELVFLLQGRLEIRMESITPHFEMPVGRVSAGEVVGVRLLLGESAAAETLVALSEGEALLIPAARSLALAREDPVALAVLMGNVAKVLARRLERSNQRLLSMMRRARLPGPRGNDVS